MVQDISPVTSGALNSRVGTYRSRLHTLVPGVLNPLVEELPSRVVKS